MQIGTLASASLLVPQFLWGTGKGKSSPGDKKLVVLQLSGGNDWLNTVIPVRNDDYYRARPVIGITKADALSLNDESGLHPSLVGLKKLYDEGHVSIVNGVGYPQPNRSHFESMRIWQTASPENRLEQTGWLGRGLDRLPEGIQAIELADSLNPALHGNNTHAVAFKNLAQFYKASTDPYLAALGHAQEHHEGLPEYLYTSVRETSSAAEYIYQQSKIYTTTQTYPATQIGRDLKLIGSLINAHADKKIYYGNLLGFDTHIGQPNKQKSLFTDLDEALTAFTGDLQTGDTFNDTVILIFSEFGRRVQENASKGTDHGAAGNILLIGGGIKKAGIYNPMPSIADLEDGDLKYKVDFRSAYATILDNWLGMPSQEVLGGNFDKLAIL